MVTCDREQCLHLHLPVLTVMRNAEYHNAPLLSAQLLVPYMVLLVPCFRFLCTSHRCVQPPTLCPRPLQSHPHAGSFGRHRVFSGAQRHGLLPPAGGVQRLTADCCRSYRWGCGTWHKKVTVYRHTYGTGMGMGVIHNMYECWPA